MNTQHTQGTWEVVSQMPNGYTIENEKGQVIAFLEDDAYENDDPNTIINDKKAYANAKLMASASDLLKALQAMIDGKERNWVVLERQAKQAINKATN